MNHRSLREMEYAVNLTNVGNKCFYAFIDGAQKTAFGGMKGFSLMGALRTTVVGAEKQ